MKWNLSRWWRDYRALPKLQRRKIRMTVEVLLLFVVLGFSGSVFYRLQEAGLSSSDIQRIITEFLP